MKKPKPRQITIHLDRCVEHSEVTLRQISKDTDLSISTISRIKTGKQLPDLKTVQVLCNYLECDLSDMVSLE